MLQIIANEMMRGPDMTSPEVQHRREILARKRMTGKAARAAWVQKFLAFPGKLGLFSGAHKIKAQPSAPHVSA
jgi:hypothetical protein